MWSPGSGAGMRRRDFIVALGLDPAPMLLATADEVIE
jgi:hypothetical protein